jgi:2-dehydro-3-deoxygluconokinase
MSKRYITFGEVMLRLAPPGHETLLQSSSLNATFGGAEANVSVSLSNYGEDAVFVTALPSNPIADAAIRELKSFGVDTSFIKRKGDRVGIYFAEPGASMRPSKIIYDRNNSSISTIEAGDFDWKKIFDGAHWFHVTGITPAIAKGTADVTMEAVKTAKGLGLTVSCDLNYRKKLWKWGKEPQEVMSELTRYVDVLIANEEDCQKCLGIDLDVDVTAGKLDVSKYEEIAAKVMRQFPNISHLSVSLRESLSADWNNWSVFMATKNASYKSRKYEIRDIVDRIGGGDAFASGLMWALNNLENPQEIVNFAAAASALKHTIYGDYNRVSLEDVKTLSGGDSSGRVQR